MKFTHHNYLETKRGDKFYICDIVTVEYYDGRHNKQTITGRLWFLNADMLHIFGKRCEEEVISTTGVINIKDADI